MLAFFRTVVVAVFALLIGISAYSLREMHEIGTLMEKHNYRRRVNAVLMTGSILALSALGYFEKVRRKRWNQRHMPYGNAQRQTNLVPAERTADKQNLSSVYTVPETVAGWKKLHSRSFHPHKKAPIDKARAWLAFLQTFGLLTTVFHGTMLVYNLLLQRSAANGIHWLLPAGFGAVLVLSILTSVSLLLGKRWGIALGYVLAGVSFLVFPFGTLMGLFLVIGLAGAAPMFDSETQKTRLKTA